MGFPSDPRSLQCYKECLEALPRLHTLEITDTKMDSKSGMAGFTKKTFNFKCPDFPSIRKVTVPLIAHPIVSRFPNMEELVCFSNCSWKSVKPVLASVRGPYAREKSGEIEPVLKSFTIISTDPDMAIAEGM